MKCVHTMVSGQKTSQSLIPSPGPGKLCKCGYFVLKIFDLVKIGCWNLRLNGRIWLQSFSKKPESHLKIPISSKNNGVLLSLTNSNIDAATSLIPIAILFNPRESIETALLKHFRNISPTVTSEKGKQIKRTLVESVASNESREQLAAMAITLYSTWVLIFISKCI